MDKQYSNKFNLPESIVRAILNDPYDAGNADISTTRLISPPQVEELRRRHKDDIIEDVSERVWSFLGQACHKIAERAAAPGAIAEQRYFAQMEGWTVSGAVDLIEGTELVDYKVTSVWTLIYGSRIDEWTEQGNVNRWLYEMNRRRALSLVAASPDATKAAAALWPEIATLRNILILRDWSAKDAAKKADYPKVQIVAVPLELWTMEHAEEYVRERVLLHQRARMAADDRLPRCSDDDNWQGRRCAKYCAASAFCAQFQNSQMNNSEDK